MVVESHRTITHDGAANYHSSCKVAVFCSRDCANGSTIAASYLLYAFGRWRWTPWSIARLPLVCMAGTKLRIVTFMQGTVPFSTERAARPSTSQRLAVKNWSSHSTWGACAERHYTLFLCCPPRRCFLRCWTKGCLFACPLLLPPPEEELSTERFTFEGEGSKMGARWK